MAKSAEEKAAAQAAKAEAKAEKAAAQEAKAEAKAAAKAEAKAEKSAVEQLKSAQKAEITALKQSGADKSVIKAENNANKIELSGAKDFIKQAGNQSANVGIRQTLDSGQSVITSKASAYSGDTANFVNNLINSAAQNYSAYNIPNISKSGGSTSGVGLDKLVKYESGIAGSSINRLMENAQTYVGQSFTPEQLKDAGLKVKEVKGMDGVYQLKSGSGEVKNYTFFIKDPNTGQLVGTGVNRTYTPEAGGVAGFLQSDLGKVVMVGASIFGAPYIGGMITGLSGAGAAAINAAVGNAAISAATTAAAGGNFQDVLKSAGIAAASSYAGTSAAGAVPETFNPAIIKAIQGAASSATQAALSGQGMEGALRAAMTGAAVGGVGSGIQQLVSSATPGTWTGEVKGITGFADAADEVGGAGAGGPSNVQVYPVAPWDQTVTEIPGTFTYTLDNGSTITIDASGEVVSVTPATSYVQPTTTPTTTTPTTVSTDAEAQPGGFYGSTDTSYTTPSGVVVTDKSIPYDSSYVEPSTWDSIKNLGEAVYDFAVQNPYYVALIGAGIIGLNDLITAATGGGGGTKPTTPVTPPVIPPFNLNVGSFNVSGGSGTTGGYGGGYGTPTFAPRAAAVVTPPTYADRPLLGTQAPGSPIVPAQGLAALAAPAPTNLLVPTIVRPGVNVSPEGYTAQDVAQLLTAQEAARYNATPAIQAGESARFGETPVAPVAAAEAPTGMRAGGVADLAQYGRYGDTMLAHISPQEAAMLKSMGGSGTINPVTGLPEYWNPLKKLARYVPYIAPFIPGLNVAQAAMLGGVAGAMGGDKGFDLKRGLMSGLMSYGIGSLAEGLSAAGQPVASDVGPIQPEPKSLANMAQGASNVMTGAPGAKEALAAKFGTGAGISALMGGTGVAAIDEQAAFAAQQQREMAEEEEKQRRNREYAMGLINQYPIRFAAEGGEIDDELGYDFAAGGALPPRFLSGGGDGMSDSIPANIEGKQQARLADGEFVIPADVVSGIGNGSSKAGAKQLYAMMDRVRKARTGTTRQGREINPVQFMPA